jgi:hypothetical protein
VATGQLQILVSSNGGNAYLQAFNTTVKCVGGKMVGTAVIIGGGELGCTNTITLVFA